MQIQSLSVVVPTTGCVNKCPFCVSRMRSEEAESDAFRLPLPMSDAMRSIYLPGTPEAATIDEDDRKKPKPLYANRIEKCAPDRSAYYERQYTERMAFARDNGCNTVMLTGEGEPLQNLYFLERFQGWNESLGDRRFRSIELQSSGFRTEDANLTWLRDHVGVTTISLSVSDLFHDDDNARIVGMPEKFRYGVESTCRRIKDADLNLRVSVNMTKALGYYRPDAVFARLREMGADQAIFRVLYRSDADEIVINQWIDENRASDETVGALDAYIREVGAPLERLPFGTTRYSVQGISTVVDENCMPHELTDSFRYLILRPDCRLYSRWDDRGSLLW